ncbi:glucans biosynthesis glucosyltransferase MdoH [Rhodomicrobium sp.]|uniref:glucans biosynthesis glucosyltransferase MdoH n=1 Tax=Rhodomicrobium sp. TaxID=2720632 RepID=UPI0039E6D67E
MHDTLSPAETPAVPASRVQSVFAPQSLDSFDRTTRRKLPMDVQAPLRRFLIFGGAFAITIYLIVQLYLVLSVGSFGGLGIALVVLFSINIFWLSLSFMTALAGFFVIATGMRRSLVKPEDYDAKAPLTGRTAILVCTYNEAPARIFGMAVATLDSIAKLGQGKSFDLFILSDTTDPDVWVQEEAAFQSVREREACGHRIFYRRRSQNTGKKAGNVADWCRRWGANYEYMLVLDADSLMTGESVTKLAAIIEKNPDFGLVQTVPLSIGRNTLFARLQQFAGRLYGPMLATGLAFWHRGTSNFWGHNAIIRTRAFIESAGLPMLPGKPPFGGQILSHDFVEAALLNRAGWRVVMVPDLAGSYEEIPPALIDFAMRDRRWAQGNLQHSRVMFADGLHWVSRVHMAMGIMAYVSALVWFLFIIIALALTLQSIYTLPQYFTDDFSLFPKWPMQDSERSLQLLILTLSVLLLPKLFAYVLALMDSRQRKGFGGPFLLFVGVLIETVLSSLFAHIMMLLQSGAVVDVFRGRDSGWKPQRRDDGSLPFWEIMQFHRLHMMIGIALAIGTWYSSKILFLWMLPASLGLVFAGPLSWWSAQRSAGEGFRRFGLLQIEEEKSPPSIAGEAHRAQAEVEKAAAEHEAITQLVKSPKLRRLHRELIQMQPITLESRISPNLAIGRAKLDVSANLSELLSLLKPGEKAALLSDPESLARLEAFIPAEIPPEKQPQTSAQPLEQTT